MLVALKIIKSRLQDPNNAFACRNTEKLARCKTEWRFVWFTQAFIFMLYKYCIYSSLKILSMSSTIFPHTSQFS
uniref:Uncharacterized protein n=1 Tax=Anguilla anguilla TaxID=7936 RepID=A0A0E9SI10_ANGAN